MQHNIIENKNLILQWVSENRSKAFMAKELSCKQETLNKYMKKWAIDYKGNQGGKGTNRDNDRYMSLTDYLSNSTDIQSNKVRNKLLKEGYKEHCCECCGQTLWMGNPIPLELHHKDGNKDNNTLENYELLCPNCHALTDSYRGRNCRKHTRTN